MDVLFKSCAERPVRETPVSAPAGPCPCLR
jgi:hypothetical protein